MPATDLIGAPAPPAITPDQLTLIKQTIAKDATDAELSLFLYDNARRGIHPLDRLIHFSKRGGKYTPITSIDYMRSRAAQTGDYAGSEDALFQGTVKTESWSATVTVWRLVHEQPCRFTATARWAEYKPAEDFMYQKMPHTMLAKCAEALALRKGFPQELSGLYAAEEMAQAPEDEPHPTHDPRHHPAPVKPAPVPLVEASAERAATIRDEPADNTPIPDSRERILRVTLAKIAKTGKSTKGPWTLHVIKLSDGREAKTFSSSLYGKAAALAQTGALVDVRINSEGELVTIEPRDPDEPF